MSPDEPDATTDETTVDPTGRPLPPTDDVEPPPEEGLVDRARGTGVGVEDETIVPPDEPRLVTDPDPDADPGAVT